jgi:hypothetical protein
MDTTETGGFLTLTQGLQVGGGNIVIWAPASYSNGSGLIGDAFPPKSNFKTIVWQEDIMPQYVLREAATILLELPADESEQELVVEGFLLPGQMVVFKSSLNFNADPAQVTVTFEQEFFAGSSTSDARYISFPMSIRFTHNGQVATLAGVDYPKHNIFGRGAQVIGAYAEDPANVSPPAIIQF